MLILWGQAKMLHFLLLAERCKTSRVVHPEVAARGVPCPNEGTDALSQRRDRYKRAAIKIFCVSVPAICAYHEILPHTVAVH